MKHGATVLWCAWALWVGVGTTAIRPYLALEGFDSQAECWAALRAQRDDALKREYLVAPIRGGIKTFTNATEKDFDTHFRCLPVGLDPREPRR